MYEKFVLKIIIIIYTIIQNQQYLNIFPITVRDILETPEYKRKSYNKKILGRHHKVDRHEVSKIDDTLADNTFIWC